MMRQTFIQACFHYLSLPYKWGGDDPLKGFDCSGLIQEIYSMIGLDPIGDQTAQGLYNHFAKQRGIVAWIPKAVQTQPKTGSLCFYGKSTKEISHIGMIIEGDVMIEAGAGDSTTHTVEDASKKNAYLRLRSYKRRGDLVAILTPPGLPW